MAFSAGPVSFRLDGLAAIVTGGSRGIGRGIVEAFSAAGARVLLSGRKQESLDEAVDAIREAGGEARGFAGNVSEEAGREELVDTCLDAFGRFDILVNNAGTNPQYGPLAEADMAAVRKVWQVNQEAPLALAQVAWRKAFAQKGGVIINMASVGGLRPAPLIGAYAVSKAALIHMTRQLAVEMAPGVRVNALAPGLIRTKFSEALYAGHEEETAAAHPLRRLGEPADVAAAAVFLASPASSWITGQIVEIDGGASLTSGV